MGRVFLDANVVIDFLERKEAETRNRLKSNTLYITPLSIHILLYLMRLRIPYSKLTEIKQYFSIIEFNESIMYSALGGPTDDFEDNVQLHSAAEAECDLFLTEDKRLIGMKFFGKTRITGIQALQ